MENKGYVYVLTNPCFKENWVKIGFTDNIERRIFELSQATGIPLPFEMYAVLKTAKYRQAENMIHKLIGKLAPDKRINPKREFFNIEPEDALSIIKDVAELLDDAELSYNEIILATKNNISKSNGKKAPIKTFYSMGLKNGDIVRFSDTQYTATVCGERLLEYENEKMFTSALAYKLALKIGLTEKEAQNYSSSGFGVFKYDDQDINLYARWIRLNGGVKLRNTQNIN